VKYNQGLELALIAVRVSRNDYRQGKNCHNRHCPEKLLTLLSVGAAD